MEGGDMDLEEIQKLCELTERCEAAEARVEELERSLNAKWSDHVNGTPCAAIRWAYECDGYLSYIEDLKELFKVPLKAYLQYVAGKPSTVEDFDVWIRRVQQALADAPPCILHSDDEAVNRFAIAMKTKLAEARAKGKDGWDDPDRCSVEYLADMLKEHMEKDNPGNFIDIANLAMMLHLRNASPSLLTEGE